MVQLSENRTLFVQISDVNFCPKSELIVLISGLFSVRTHVPNTRLDFGIPLYSERLKSGFWIVVR